MLEVIIKQNDKQIGQLQFDSNWKYEDAMNVLGIYVSREIPIKRTDAQENDETITNEEEDVVVASETSSDKPLVDRSSDEPTFIVGLAASRADSSPPTSTLKPEDYDLVDRYAVGKKRVMKYQGQSVTGNHIAVLLAIKELGDIDKANDLTDALAKDARYDSQFRGGTYRTILLTLGDLGFVEKRDDDSRAITDLGREVASMFTILPKAESGQQS